MNVGMFLTDLKQTMYTKVGINTILDVQTNKKKTKSSYINKM